MTEKKFLKFYQKELGLSNFETAKERAGLFWESVFLALENNKRVVFKDWGIFYTKDVKSRRVKVPIIDHIIYSQPKRVIKFSCGKGLREKVNSND